MAIGGGSAATVFVDVEGDLSKFKSDVSQAGDIAQKELGKSSKFATAGKLAGGAIIGGVVGALGAGLSSAMEKEQLELNFAAGLGLDQTSAEFEALTKSATDLYRNAWGDTLEDTQSAMSSAYAAFYSGPNGETSLADLESYSEQALAIAETYGMDVAEVMSAAQTVFFSGITADNPDEAFDALTAAAQQVPEALRGEIFDAGIEYSQFFNDLGFGSSEAFGILVANAGDGAYGIDKAGDAIKEFTIRATDGSKSTVDAFNLIGVDAAKMGNDILAGGDTAKAAFDEIVAGLLSIEDPTARANAAISLFGTPIEDLGTQDIPRFLQGLQGADEVLGDISGTAQEMADVVGGSAAASFESLKREGMGVLSDFAETTLLPVMADLLPVLTDFVGFIGELPAPLKTAGVGAALFGGGLLLLAGPIMKTTKLVSGFFSLMSANPWVLIIAATIALVYIIVTNWDTIVEYVTAAWEGIKTGVSDAWNWIREKTSEIWNAVADFFVQYWPYILGIFTGGLGLVIGLIVQNWDSIWSKTQEIWNAISGFLGGVLSGIGGFFQDYIISPVSAIIGFFQDLPETASNAWTAVKNAISDAKDGILSALGEIGSAADRALGPLDEIAGFAFSGIGKVGGLLGFDDGGVVPGPTGSPRLVLAHGGETFIPTHKRGMEGAAGGGGDSIVVNLHDATIRNDDDVLRLARMLAEETRRSRRSQGGKNA